MNLKLQTSVKAAVVDAAVAACEKAFNDARLKIRVHISKGIGQRTLANLELSIVNAQDVVLMTIPIEGMSSLADGDVLTITGLKICPEIQVGMD